MSSKLLHASVLEARIAHVLVDYLVFMVATIQEHMFRESELDCKNQANHFNLLRASVNPVPIEDEARPVEGWETVVMKEKQQIPELPVDVAKNLSKFECKRDRTTWTGKRHGLVELNTGRISHTNKQNKRNPCIYN